MIDLGVKTLQENLTRKVVPSLCIWKLLKEHSKNEVEAECHTNTSAMVFI